jgi:regulator of sirC expression with transglutaminase-like and TPR domain
MEAKTPPLMPSWTPQCCRKSAFELMSREVGGIETPTALVRSAVAIATHQYPQSDPDETLGTLVCMGNEIRQRIRGEQPQALLAHLHDYLFEELGFSGNQDDYYHPGNSYLPQVLRTRRGLPIVLSLIYVAVARSAGLTAWGVGLPGHFIAAVEIEGKRLLVDPFDGGRLLTSDDAAAKMRDIYGPESEFTDELLEPVSHRMWLTRIMQNLLRSFGASGQYADVGAMLELEMLLWPRQDHLQRDLALVLARLGMSRQAGAWLDTYLRNNPDDPQKQDLEQLLTSLTG